MAAACAVNFVRFSMDEQPKRGPKKACFSAVVLWKRAALQMTLCSLQVCSVATIGVNGQAVTRLVVDTCVKFLLQASEAGVWQRFSLFLAFSINRKH